MEPNNTDFLGRWVIKTCEDGTEEFEAMSKGNWRKITISSQTYDKRYREATAPEIDAFFEARQKAKSEAEGPLAIEEDVIKVEDLPDEPPVSPKAPETPSEEVVNATVETVNEKIDKIRTYDALEEYLILEHNFEEELDRTKLLKELREEAKVKFGEG